MSVVNRCPSCRAAAALFTLPSQWGHVYACCSDRCGRAYATSRHRAARELEAAQKRVDAAIAERDHWAGLAGGGAG